MYYMRDLLVSIRWLTPTLCARDSGAAPKKKKEPEGGPRLIIPIEKIRDKQKGKAYELPSAPADEVDYHWKLFQAKQAENAAKNDTGPTAIRVVVRLRPFNDREKVEWRARAGARACSRARARTITMIITPP